MDESRFSERLGLLIEASIQPFVDDFKRRWSASPSEKPRIEQYLAGRGEVEKSAVLFYLLDAELQLLRQGGTWPKKDDYRHRFPEHSSLVGAAFGDMDTADYERASTDTSRRTPNDVRRPGTDTPTEMRVPPAARESPAEGRKPLGRIGDYELLRVIGRGGMGIVYEAKQCSLNRIVAVKRILSGAAADTEEIQRFRAEAETAAGLDHPHIVPIHEIGEHEGQPYFSMGFVDGKSLVAYTAEAPLPERKTADLVRKITDAVAHAHRQGIIHRDLKPGNVLVDQWNEPHITDFGLAKQVDARGGGTVTGQVLGTPSYMPPEQAEGRIKDVGKAADIYAIGATLYFLLTARPPFLAPTPIETLLQVCEKEPLPPRKLTPWITRDLETICLKCLEKEPHRRYPSAGSLADDLARFLRHEPISARRITTLERSVRWARRRPAIALLASIILVGCVVAGSVFGGYHVRLQQTNSDLQQAVTTTEQQRQRADHNATMVAEQRELALDTLRLMVWDTHDVLQDTPATLLLKERLLTTAIDGLSEIPGTGEAATLIDRTNAIAHTRLGDVLLGLGRSEGAKREYEHAVAILQRLRQAEADPDKTDDDLAVTRERLGHLCLRYEQDVKSAIEHYRTAEELREDLVARSPESSEAKRDLSVAYESLGDAYLLAGQWTSAEDFFQRSLDIRQQAVGDRDTDEARRDLSVAYGKLGELKLQSEQFTAAREILEKALAIDRQRAKADPTPRNLRDLTVTYTKLGRAIMRMDDADTALEFHQKSLALRRTLAEQDPNNADAVGNVTTALDDVGNANLAQGNVTEAFACYRESMQLREQLVKQDPKNLSFKRGLYISLERLASVSMEQKDLPAALQNLQRSLALRQELADDDRQNAQMQQDLAIAYNWVATVIAQMGDFQRAREHYQKSLDICQSLATTTHTASETRGHPELVRGRTVRRGVGRLPAGARIAPNRSSPCSPIG